jgi:uncharacterized protein YggE
MVTVSAQDNSIRVVGVGTVQVPIDTVIIAVGTQNDGENSTLAEARNSELLNRTMDSLIAAGVRKEEIMPDRPKSYMTYHKRICNTVNNTTSCSDVTRDIVEERLIIKLKTSDSSWTQKVIDAAKSSGANAAILRYALNDPSKAVDQARKEALDDAKGRAEDCASIFGFGLGKAIDVEEQTYPDIEIGPNYPLDMPWRMNQIFWMRPFHMMKPLFGGNYIPEGMAEVTAYVSVTYKVGSA